MAGDFDLNKLLAGPILAMNDAQSDAAASFYELFERFAFETPAAGPADTTAARRLRMISFVAERAGPDGAIQQREISMPLLQMIPVGGVGIDSAKIEFSLAVTAEPGAAPRRPGPEAAPASNFLAERVALKARIAPGRTTDAVGETGNLKVEIVLKQLDLPAGYLDMIAETQGGMSRPLPPPAPPAGDGEQTDERLFTATLASRALVRFEPGQPVKFALDLTPDRNLLGPEGLEVRFEADPPAALSVTAPSEGRLVVAEQVRTNVEGVLGRVVAGDQFALLVSGVTQLKDGGRIRHQVRIPLTRPAPA